MITFRAPVIAGSGTAATLGIRTLNLSLDAVPTELSTGIYACRVSYDSKNDAPAVMHYGPRPMHQLPPSCEVHLLNETVKSPPLEAEVIVVEKIRDISTFPSEESLKTAIQRDINSARVILGDA